MQEKKLGELLLLDGYVTDQQLGQALARQKGSGQPIGQILCEMGSLKPRDLAFALDHYKKRRRLGEILVAQKLITPERLEHCLKVSSERQQPLGLTLVRHRLLTEEQIARAVAVQNDLKFVNLSELSFDPGLSRLVNPSFARRLGIVPVRCRDRTLTMAMSRHLGRDELARLESWCKMPIVPVIAKESDIALAQEKVFPAGAGGEKAQRPPERLKLELSEDHERERSGSRYVREVISPDVEDLARRIIGTGIRAGTSDIHLENTENGLSVRYRLDGILQHLDLGCDQALINVRARQIVSKLKILCDMDIAERRRPQDSSFKMKVTRDGEVRSVDFRVSTVPTPYGENVVIRILDKRAGVISLEGLGYAADLVERLYRALEQPTGLFLVTGPTGSGKSTALYALLSRINTPGAKTLTIEDPIEYTLPGITQTEVNEAIGNSFAKLLRSFLRQDPDNIMVGEIRDAETAAISLRAALTGHCVFSTLHTNDATSAFTRLLDLGLDPGPISDTLRLVLAQRLVRRICPECRAAYWPVERLLDAFGLKPGAGHFLHGTGCPACNFTGFSGRLPVAELWIPGPEELLLLQRRPDSLSLRGVVFGPGRRTMFEDGLRLVQAGETTFEELARVVPYEQIQAGRQRLSRTAGAAERANIFRHRQSA